MIRNLFVASGVIIAGIILVSVFDSPPEIHDRSPLPDTNSTENTPPAKEAKPATKQRGPDIATSQVAAKTVLESMLKDPSTAEYQNVYAVPEPNGLFAFCGEVNAKNGFGGFTGYLRFIATPVGAFLGDAPDFDQTWSSECEGAGAKSPVSF